MDEERLTLLVSDVEAQMGMIETIYEKLEERATGLHSDDEVRLESVAYQLHNLYNAIEDLFQLIAAHFENQVKDTSRWHTTLLQRMKQKVGGIRPALLSEESYALLMDCAVFDIFSGALMPRLSSTLTFKSTWRKRGACARISSGTLSDSCNNWRLETALGGYGCSLQTIAPVNSKLFALSPG